MQARRQASINFLKAEGVDPAAILDRWPETRVAETVNDPTATTSNKLTAVAALFIGARVDPDALEEMLGLAR